MTGEYKDPKRLVPFMVRVPDHHLDQLYLIASESGESMATLIRGMIREYLKDTRSL